MKHTRFLFSSILFFLLYFVQWKKQIVFANYLYIYSEHSLKDANNFYKKLLTHLSIHAVDFLSSNTPYKKVPSKTINYPFFYNDLEFSIDTSSQDTIQKMKSGGLFMTAHYGNYEAIGPWLCKMGIPLKASYAPIKPLFLNNILENKIRAVNNESYSFFINNPKNILNLIDEGKLFCLIADQDYRKSKPIQSTFLGKPVLCNPIPEFILKHRPNTPIYFCHLHEEGNKRILFAKEIKLIENNLNTIYPQFHQWLEELINENNELWYGWIHRRFLGKSLINSIYQHNINKSINIT